MGKFEFRKKEIVLDIEGVCYSILLTTKFLERMKEYGQKMVAYARDMAGAEDLKDVTAFMLGTLDEILGEEAVDVIFHEREAEILDILELFNYIREEIEAYQGQRVANLQPTENRAMRRARE